MLWPGFAYSLSLDTSELVAAAFLLGALLAAPTTAVGGRPARCSPLAVLTRDTTAVVPFGRRRSPGPGGRRREEPATADDADAGRRRRPARRCSPGWQLLQRARFGSLPLTSSGDNNLSAPVRRAVDQLGDGAPAERRAEAFRLLSIIGLVALLGAAPAWCWPRARDPARCRAASPGSPPCAVVLVLNAYLWSGATAFMRAATEAGLLSILCSSGRRRPPAGRGRRRAWARLWLLTAVAQVGKLG